MSYEKARDDFIKATDNLKQCKDEYQLAQESLAFATEQLTKAQQLYCRAYDALQGEDEPKPKKNENLCSTCAHGVKVPKSKQPIQRRLQGNNRRNH